MAAHVGVLLVAGGIIGLGLGAAWLVDGASRLALRLGVAPMIVGITVVGFGTSMPEFSVSVLAAASGSRDLSLGNAVGSNIMNLLLVLGVAALLRPMQVVGSRRALLRDVGFGLLPMLLILPAAFSGILGRWTALGLIGIFLVFMLFSIQSGRRTRSSITPIVGSPLRHVLLVFVGTAVLILGSEAMVRGSVGLARLAGISEALIGLTLVAFGTSLPELATSVTASLKGESELSIGNVLGSNVFNLGLIVGVAFTLCPGPVSAIVIRRDVPFLAFATLIVALVVLRNRRIGRLGGAAMLAVFLGYLALLVATGGGS